MVSFIFGTAVLGLEMVDFILGMMVLDLGMMVFIFRIGVLALIAIKSIVVYLYVSNQLYKIVFAKCKYIYSLYLEYSIITTKP